MENNTKSTMMSFDNGKNWVNPDRSRRKGKLLDYYVEQYFQGDPILVVKQEYHDPGQHPATAERQELLYRSRISSRLMPENKFTQHLEYLKKSVDKEVSIKANEAGLEMDFPSHIVEQGRG